MLFYFFVAEMSKKQHIADETKQTRTIPFILSAANDTLAYVFTFLDSRDWVKASRTCKLLHTVSQMPLAIPRTICFSSNADGADAFVVKHGHLITRVCHGLTGKSSDEVANKIKHWMPRFRNLKAFSCEFLNPEEALSALPKTTPLETLRCAFPIRLNVIWHFQQLRVLTLADMSSDHIDLDDDEICPTFPNLESIELIRNGDSVFRTITAAPKLRRLLMIPVHTINLEYWLTGCALQVVDLRVYSGVYGHFQNDVWTIAQKLKKLQKFVYMAESMAGWTNDALCRLVQLDSLQELVLGLFMTTPQLREILTKLTEVPALPSKLHSLTLVSIQTLPVVGNSLYSCPLRALRNQILQRHSQLQSLQIVRPPTDNHNEYETHCYEERYMSVLRSM